MGREQKPRIGKQIRALRQTFGWTREDAAERAEIALDTLARYERGERQPGLPIALRLASVLGVSVEELSTGEIQEGKRTLERQVCGLLPSLSDEQLFQVRALISAMLEGSGHG